MKTKEQIEKRINQLEKRIEQLWIYHDKHKTDFYFNKIEILEQKIDLLNWILCKE